MEKKLSEHDVHEICKLLIEQDTLKSAWRKVSNPALADRFGVSTSTIEYIKRNKLRRYAK
jgi:hypothetical protein